MAAAPFLTEFQTGGPMPEVALHGQASSRISFFRFDRLETSGFEFARPFDRIEEHFSALADWWSEATAHLSSPVEKTNHPAFVRLAKLGRPAIGLALRQLQHESSPGWFILLRRLNDGVSPVPPDAAGDSERIRDAWLTWGRKNGLI